MSLLRVTFLAFMLSVAGSTVSFGQTKTTTKTTTKPAAKTTTKTTAKTPAKTTTKATTTKPAATTPKTTTVTTPAAPVVAPLTADEAVLALREALTQGVTKGFEAGGQADGFNGNPDIRLTSPPDIELLTTTLRSMRMGTLVDNFELLLNRSAESVAKQAGPIYLKAVQNLSFPDALALVNSRESRAASQLLKQSSEAQVKEELAPLVQQALEQTGAVRVYGELVLRYNKIPLVTPIKKADLTSYTTQKTSDGLYTLIADEESHIRLSSASRTTAALKRAFGSQK
jgi:hypothetical protein